MKRLLVFVVFLSWSVSAWAGGAREQKAVASDRTQYLAAQGVIIPYQEIKIDEFIGALDYDYPDPDGELGVSIYTGHEQVSVRSQHETLLIGVQGKRRPFQDLLPLNLALVVDKSGSMREPDKLDWIKESLTILLDTVRDKDYVALVVFDEQARVLVPSVRIGDPETRERLRTEIEALSSEGGSNIAEGLKLGIREVVARFSPGYANRVLLLTDGWGRAEGVRKLLKEHRVRGIEVSVIGYGKNFDAHFAEELVDAGGGSSRFISDRERMQEVFAAELASSTVALVRDVEVKVSLKAATVMATGGADHRINDTRTAVTYTVSTLHSGDYETMLLDVTFPPKKQTGRRTVALVETSFSDLQGVRQCLEPVEVALEFVETDNPVAGFSDARVLRAVTMLQYAQALQEISGTYAYSPQAYGPFFTAFQLRKQLTNTRLRLGENTFDDELAVLEQYMRILGRQIGLKDPIVEQIIADEEMAPPEKNRPLPEHLDNLFRELLLRLKEAPSGNLAVCGFSMPGSETPSLLDYVNEAGAMQLAKLAGSEFTVVERSRLDEVLREQELALSDLVEPGRAVRVGKILAADYLVTGTVIAMSESVVIFSRIINVETAVIESAAQVIIPRNEEVNSLL
jgi:hypothetical protein